MSWRSNSHRGAGARHNYAALRPVTITHSTANTEPELLPDAEATEGLLPDPLQTFSVPTTSRTNEHVKFEPVKLENFKCIGSYNWLDRPHPTILVPGTPSPSI